MCKLSLQPIEKPQPPIAAPRGVLSCQRSVVHTAHRSAHAGERQSSPDCDLRNYPSSLWSDDLSAQRTEVVRIRTGMSTDEKRHERCDLNARRVQPRWAWNADVVPSPARPTHGKRRASAIQKRTVVLSSTSLSPGGTAVNDKVRAAVFRPPLPPGFAGWLGLLPVSWTRR